MNERLNRRRTMDKRLRETAALSLAWSYSPSILPTEEPTPGHEWGISLSHRSGSASGLAWMSGGHPGPHRGTSPSRRYPDPGGRRRPGPAGPIASTVPLQRGSTCRAAGCGLGRPSRPRRSWRGGLRALDGAAFERNHRRLRGQAAHHVLRRTGRTAASGSASSRSRPARLDGLGRPRCGAPPGNRCDAPQRGRRGEELAAGNSLGRGRGVSGFR